jgi:predicted alpha/beta-hydrolase family hydrolase
VPQLTVPTGQGPALVDWTAPASGPVSFVLALTHGAGGTPGSPDLLAARDAAVAQGGGVALITQPYRVRGARAPGNADRQDEAWIELMTWLLSPSAPIAQPPHKAQPYPEPREAELPLIVGGRSNGARVACRTAAAVAARGVLALAFPLQPPARRVKGSDEAVFPPNRSPELQEAIRGGAHVLVLNGDRDPFGIPAASEVIQVVVLKGETHSLSKKPPAVAAAVTKWLADLGLAAPCGVLDRRVSAGKREQSVKREPRNRL